MSNGGVEPRHERLPEWDRLELSVRRLLDDYDRWRERARAAQQRIQALEAALRDMTSGRLDPLELAARVEALEAENRELRNRLAQARERVSLLKARLRFLEEKE